ncbi:hypothetical protein [Boudabousia marimammalium]|uniref:Uncharacterized protein n=1 Tax=Boudabousia marimammalium TaxID=156892 RepID=A0A1Q5PM16_9ACTO|nr:hypothetical protein [Boudabousia marimammalium]OKL48115.1 hypothetical protein BM477_06570 [Boudabousia marimammalium]
MSEPITTKMPNWVAVIIAIILLGTMGGSMYWIYDTYRNPPKLQHAGAIPVTIEGSPSSPEAGDDPALANTRGPKTEQVKQLAALTPVNPEDYRTENGIIRFRSASSNEVCAYAEDISQLANDRWVRLAPTGDEPALSGPGVACSLVLGPNLPREEDRRSCPEHELKGRSATLTGTFVGYGACHDGHNPVTEDARTDSHDRDRIPERVSGVKELANGSTIELGRFKCGGLLPNMTCVDLQTGRGFGVSAGQYLLIPPAK